MPKVEVEAIVATSHPIAAYGGVRFDDTVLIKLADAILSGELPMLLQHDIRRPLDPEILDARVRDRPDGYKEVWIRFLVDEGIWEEFDQARIAADAPGGFSVSCSEPLAEMEGPSTSPVVFGLAADASHWPDEELLAAADDLRAVGAVKVGRRYEFAFVPAAVVDLVAPILTGVVANAVYDALRRFLRPNQPTIFHFHVEQDGDVVDARLETENAEALHSAIDAFDQLVNPERPFFWDNDEGRWKPL
jgi:hypothetical protein